MMLTGVPWPKRSNDQNNQPMDTETIQYFIHEDDSMIINSPYFNYYVNIDHSISNERERERGGKRRRDVSSRQMVGKGEKERERLEWLREVGDWKAGRWGGGGGGDSKKKKWGEGANL